MQAQPDRFESDHRQLLSAIDRADRRYFEAMDRVKDEHFCDMAATLDIDASARALELVEDLFAAVKFGESEAMRNAFDYFTTEMHDMMRDAAIEGAVS